jgi:hypothetical protein
MISKRITALALGAALAAASPAFAVPPPHGPHGTHGGRGHWHGGGGYGHGGGHWVGGRWIPWAVGGAILGRGDRSALLLRVSGVRLSAAVGSI